MKFGTSKIVVFVIVIAVVIIGMSIITLPRTHIVNDKNKELAPESKISIQPGFLTEIDSVRIFRTNSQAANIIAGSQDQEVDGTLSEDSGAYFFEPHGNFSKHRFFLSSRGIVSFQESTFEYAWHKEREQNRL